MVLMFWSGLSDKPWRNLCSSPTGSLFSNPLQALHSANGRQITLVSLAILRHHPSQMGIAALHPELLFHSLQILQQPCTSPPARATSNFPDIFCLRLSAEREQNCFRLPCRSGHHTHHICHAAQNSTLPAGARPCSPGPTRPKRGSSGRTGPGKQEGYSGRCGRSG